MLRLLAIELVDLGGFVLRETISESIRDITGNPDTNEEQIEKSISLLRAAFARKRIIETKRNVGYRLTLSPEEVRVF